MAKKRLLSLNASGNELPHEHAMRRIRALDWVYKRLHLLDDYVEIGVAEAKEVQRAYWVCRRDYGDLEALEALEQAIAALEAAV